MSMVEELHEEEYEIESAEATAPGGGKPKEFRRSFFRMIGLLKPSKWALLFVTIIGAIGVFLTVLGPRVLGEATNLLFEGVVSAQLSSGLTQEQVVAGLRADGQDDLANMIAAMNDLVPGQGVDFAALSRVLAFVVVLYILAAIFSWLQGYVVNVVMVRAMWRLRDRVENKINSMPLSYFDRVQRGELISRVTNDIDNITTTMQQSLSGAITNILTIIGVLIMMFTLSWQLALVVLISLPLSFIVFGVIGPRSQKAFQSQWQKVGRLNSRVEESFSGHALVKVYGQSDATLAEFAKENEELYRSSFKAQFLSGLMMPSMRFIGNLSYVLLAVLGGIMVAGGQMRLGDVQAFVQYSQMFNQPIGDLGGMVAVLQSGTASAERVFELLDQADQSPDNPDAPKAKSGNGVIRFENVKFSYNPERPLIKDLSFMVEPGHTVAIVGPTGAGKTTLVNLLMRFYELDGGRILVNDQNIAELTRDAVRERTGMVLQDPWLFTGTIRDNIRFGRESATDEEIESAAQATYVDRFVRTLPDGYDTMLEEDAANLSAGEKQLLTIARAFLAQPEILILDEATSSVDTRTELRLQKAMAALREGRTSFVIAHRLSTIRDADLILVMDHGDIVEQGSHDELIAAEGAYYRLYQSQFEQSHE